MDHWAGKVMDTMIASGYESSTLVMLISDHGDSLGDHNLWRKGYPTQQVVTIPMYLRWPASMETQIPLKRGIVDTHLVELRDVFPTLADFAGTNVSHLVDGDSMFDLLRNPDTVDWRTYIDMELTSCGFNITQTWNAITDGEIKYVYWCATVDPLKSEPE